MAYSSFCCTIFPIVTADEGGIAEVVSDDTLAPRLYLFQNLALREHLRKNL
jgi:hypothetical protein